MEMMHIDGRRTKYNNNEVEQQINYIFSEIHIIQFTVRRRNV